LDRISPIYIDNHATTRVDPRVVEAMLPHFDRAYGNASSRSHPFGWEAEKAVEKGREQVALLLGADPREIVFTSGATESNNLALKGAAECLRAKGNRILSSPTEHPSVLDSLAWLRERGFEVEFLPVDARGRVAPEAVLEALRPGTILVSLMAGNNEVGTVHPIEEIGRICSARGALLHCDATQAVGRIPFRAEWVHLASLTAHKIHGPKGVGALHVRRRDPEVKLAKQIHGGGQERGMRSGTLNVPGIVGLGRACEICRLEGEEESRRVGALRDLLRERLLGAFPDLVEHGDPAWRLPGNLNVAFPGTASDALMMAMPDLALSAGSACASGSLEPSHVMKAMKVRPEIARASLRFGVGRFNTREEIERVASRVIETVRKVRRR
jgi:cysteine desulfurase